MPLLVFAFSLVLQAPPALAFFGAVATGIPPYTTMLHGFRVGFVHLGAIGMVEGMCAGALCCIAAAVFGSKLFSRPLVGGSSLGAFLLIALVAGGCLAFVPMRNVFANLADFAALLALLAAVAIWFTWGRLRCRWPACSWCSRRRRSKDACCARVCCACRSIGACACSPC